MQPDASCTVSFHTTIDDFASDQWNALLPDDNPFMRHEFLAALEHHGCVGEQFGWYPQHLAIRSENHQLIAATPLYIKTNSYGEFVFDWSWAAAYEQVGLPYYPKMVAATPYNPVTGSRLLVHADCAGQTKVLRNQLIESAIQHCKQLNLSGMHWLFTEPDEQKTLDDYGLAQRLGCQYHWFNQDYESFDDFLARFASRKRKKVKRERRRVSEQGLKIEVLHGDQIDSELWTRIHSFYISTFERKSGFPTLSLPFFEEVGQTMGSSIVVTLAYINQKAIACSICFKSNDALFGRFWGCDQAYHSLHFELCLYQGIEYCIRNRLARFEPGAQGEHKIARGFMPTETWSAHWIAHPRFSTILADFCQKEVQMMRAQCEELQSLSPYRQDDCTNG